MRRRFDMVVFDLDGVLVDSLSVTRAAFEFAYASVAGPGPAPFDVYRKYLGRRLEEILCIMGLPGSMHDPFVEESRRLLDRIMVVDGVRELLTDLKKSEIKLGVATGKSGVRAREVLDRLELRSYFDCVVGSDEVPCPKPAPDAVLRNIETAGVTAAATIMIGDAVADIRAARNARVTSAAALWGDTPADPLLEEKPDVVLRRPDDVRAVLGIADV